MPRNDEPPLKHLCSRRRRTGDAPSTAEVIPFPCDRTSNNLQRVVGATDTRKVSPLSRAERVTIAKLFHPRVFDPTAQRKPVNVSRIKSLVARRRSEVGEDAIQDAIREAIDNLDRGGWSSGKRAA